MSYILKTLKFLDEIADKTNIKYDEVNKYRDIVQEIYLNGSQEKESIIVSIELRKNIEDFLISMDIQYEKELIAKFLGLAIEGVYPENLSSLSFSLLTNVQLLRYLGVFLRTINYVQKGNLLLVKYSKTIWNTGWSNLAKECRGKVIDLKTMSIIVYPFDKFFNLGEIVETREDRILDLIDRAKKIYITDKKDGSAIIVTNVKGNVIINTNGEFSNIQVELATKMFKEKYAYFYSHIPEGYTFIFELIHPDNRIVLDYGEEKSLYLLAMRDLTTLTLKEYPELVYFAREYCLDITESFEFTNLNVFVQKTKTETENIKEGWVFRVLTEDEDVIFKLKYEEYFKLSRLKNIPSLKKVYSLLLSGSLDDALSVAEQDIKDNVLNDVAVIYDYIEDFKNLVEEESISICDMMGVVVGEVPKDKIIDIVKDLKGNPFSFYILKYIKGEMFKEDLFRKFPTISLFGELYRYVNKKKGIETDIWDSKIEDEV